MSGITARSKSAASLLTVVILASAMLAPAAVAAPASAGNSFDIPVVSHSNGTRATTHHRLPVASGFVIPLDSINANDAGNAAPWERPSAAGNSFDIPHEVGRSM
jgi:hypothetical protein